MLCDPPPDRVWGQGVDPVQCLHAGQGRGDDQGYCSAFFLSSLAHSHSFSPLLSFLFSFLFHIFSDFLSSSLFPSLHRLPLINSFIDPSLCISFPCCRVLVHATAHDGSDDTFRLEFLRNICDFTFCSDSLWLFHTHTHTTQIPHHHHHYRHFTFPCVATLHCAHAALQTR